MPNKDLKSITDNALFETISHEILRNQNDRYKTIIQTGINIDGKTIKDPVDGITLIQNDKGEIIEAIATECTTTNRTGLKAKLLKEDEPKKGDIIKSIEKLKRHKSKRPNIKLTLVLCVFNIDSKLYEDVKLRCEKEGVVVDIWGYNKLNSYLENYPEGQIIRRKYFGNKPTLISDELIDEFVESNLKAYKRDFDYFENTIEREAFRLLEDLVYASSGLILLKGESGRGKTTLCIQLYEQLISGKQFCCRISPETVAISDDFQKAIDAEFRKEYPQCDESLYEKLSLNQIFIIVDDLNRTSNPQAILNRIQSWFNDYKEVSQVPYTIICPIWNRNVAFKKIDYEETDFIKEIPLSLFSEDENQKFQEKNLKEIGNGDISKLGNDPYLLGLYAKSQKTNTSPDKLLEKSIEDEIEKHSIKNNNFTSDYEEALSSLIHFQLVNRDLYPNTYTLKEWFKNDKDSFNIIKALAIDNTLIYLSKDVSNKETLYFRHDRIHEFFIKNTLHKILTKEGFDNSIIKNPYYAEYVGKVIAKSEISDSDIDLILELQPTIIFYALKEIGEPESDYHKLIAQKSIDWFADYMKNNSRGCAKHDSIIHIICDIKSSVALELSTNLKENSYERIMILFKNGYRFGPILYFLRSLNYEPNIYDVERDEIIKDYRTKYLEQSIESVKEILNSDKPVEIKRSALIFAGYLKSPDLEEIICSFFSNHNNKEEITTESIWAILNCYSSELQEVAKPFFDFFETLTDYEDVYSSPLNTVHRRLNFENINDDNVTNFLISRLGNERLEKEIISFLRQIDSPLAIEVVLKYQIKNDNQITQRVREMLYKREIDSSFYSRVIDYSFIHTDLFFNVKKYSNKTMEKLKEIYSSSADEYLRLLAFRYWSATIDKGNLSLLQEIESNSPFYIMALKARFFLGDRKIVNEIYDDLKKQCFPNAHIIWCKELFNKIKNDLKVGENLKIGMYLLSIPETDAETLLSLYYQNKKNSSIIFQFGLYIGTQKTKMISKEIFDSTDDKKKLIQNISNVFCDKFGNRRKISESKLDNLVPYLEHFSNEQLYNLYNTCAFNKMTIWAKENIGNRITQKDNPLYKGIDMRSDECRQRFLPILKKPISLEEWQKKVSPDASVFPDEATILSRYFNSCRCECDKHCRIRSSIEKIIDHSCSKDEFKKIMTEFIQTNQDLERFKDITEAFKLIGKRSDIPILEQNAKENFGDTAKEIIEDTRFAIEERSLT